MSTPNLSTSLRIELSLNSSGEVYQQEIPLLKEKNYYVEEYALDGDAPKQFIRAYFYDKKNRFHKRNLKSWSPYIAKSAEKWYPHESIIEFIINRIGQVMGVKMNEIKLVNANNQIRFLSKYFLNKDEVLVHGAEICGQYIGDMDMAKEIAIDKNNARKLFTFEFIKGAIDSVYPDYCDELMCSFVKMLIFDAIAGNNDRHFYNWGIIGTKKKKQKRPTFAPLYDSARGLMWNLSDENIIKRLNEYKSGGKKVLNYIRDASPRVSIEGNNAVNHFELIKCVKEKNKSDYGQIIKELSSEKVEEEVLKTISCEFSSFFKKERFEIIKLILKKRFLIIRNIDSYVK